MIAQIVSVTRDGLLVTGCCRLNEGDGRGPVEYVATVPAVDAQGQPLPPAQIQQLLVEAWRLLRNRRPGPPVDLGAQINGNVNL